eukprot:2673317-Rhodomonas_salina.4
MHRPQCRWCNSAANRPQSSYCKPLAGCNSCYGHNAERQQPECYRNTLVLCYVLKPETVLTVTGHRATATVALHHA